MMQNKEKRKRPPYREFLAWMVLHDVTRQEIIELLGLSDATLSHRLNGTGADFTPTEIRLLIKKYGSELTSLFFLT